MFDVRLRLMSDDGRMRGRMLSPLEFQATMQDNGASTITFSTSELVASKLSVPFVVSLVASTNGGPHDRVRSGEFIVTDSDADDADRGKKVSFSGMEFVPWLLSMNRQHWSSSAKNGTRTWLIGKTAASVGHLISGLITEGKARGWGEFLSIGFDGTKDSNGAAWTAAERQSEAWPLLMPVSEILQQCADNGLCDWYCEGTTLQMVRPGTGPLRNGVVLGGALFSARPVRSSFKDVFTHLTVVPEKARHWLYLTNTGATSRFGRLEASQTQSGVDNHATATKNAQPALTMGRATKNELAFDWSPDAGGPVPWFDFQIGDTVWTKTRAGKALQRVIGLQINRTGQEPVKVRAITGDKMVGTAARIARKANAVSVGGSTGGTGVALPTSPGATFPVPASPAGLHVESNISQWGPDGSALTSVTLAWAAVTQAEDGSEVDVEAYQVSMRTTSSQSAVVATTDALEWTATGWPAGQTRLVRVRAVAPNGSSSQWSEEVPVIPVDPAKPAKVTGLTVVSQTGSWLKDGSARTNVTLAWDAVGVDTAGKVIPVRYEIQSRMPDRNHPGADDPTTTISSWEPGSTKWVKVRAVSGYGKGDWSDELQVAVMVPASIVPKAPTDVAIVTNVAVFEQSGLSTATVTLGWTPVTQSVDDTPVEIAEYEVLYGLETRRVRSASATIKVPSDASVQVTVRALSSLRVWSDPSVAIAVTGALPPVPSYTPSTPVLTAGMGGVAYRWDGLPSRPRGFQHVVTDVGPSAAGPWRSEGATLADAGGGAVSAAVGSDVFVRFQAFDTLGRLMGTSAVASATAAGVSLDDIPGIVNDLEAIQHTADGKNRVFLSPTQPIPGSVNLLPNGTFRADLSGWNVRTGGGNVATLSLAPEPGPNGLPYAVLALTAAGGTWWRAFNNGIPVMAGKPYTLSALLRSAATATLHIIWRNASGGTISESGVSLPVSTDWGGRFSVSGVAPAGAVAVQVEVGASNTTGPWVHFSEVQFEQSETPTPFVDAFAQGDLWLRLDPTATSVQQILVWSGSAWAPQVLLADSIIAAESITSPLIAAEAITVNHVSPTFGDDLNLSANETVTIIAGDLDAVQTRVSDQQQQIADAQKSITAANTTATAASKSAASASIAAAAAKAAAQTAQDRADQVAAVFAFETDGLGISSPGSPMSLKLSNSDISIRRNGVPRTTWNEEKMIVPILQSSQVVVGKTVITETPTGMTWQRL